MSLRRLLPVGLIAAIAVAAAPSFAAGDTFPTGKSYYGQPAVEAPGARLVDTTKVKSLNVVCGDTVTFVNGSKKFSWKFDSVVHSEVPFAKIAPADFGGVTPTVFVSRNEFERRG